MRHAKSGYMLQIMLPTICHWNRLRRATRAVTRLYDEALQGTDLTVTQFSLMRSISRLDSPYISSLAEATGLERSTLGRNLRPLEKAGLVQFSQGDDARQRVVKLSRKGRKTLEDAVPQWQMAQDQMATILTDKQLAELEVLLDAVTTA